MALVYGNRSVNPICSSRPTTRSTALASLLSKPINYTSNSSVATVTAITILCVMAHMLLTTSTTQTLSQLARQQEFNGTVGFVRSHTLVTETLPPATAGAAAVTLTTFQQYDEDGNLISKRDRRGVVTRHRYDFARRLVETKTDLAASNGHRKSAGRKRMEMYTPTGFETWTAFISDCILTAHQPRNR